MDELQVRLNRVRLVAILATLTVAVLAALGQLTYDVSPASASCFPGRTHDSIAYTVGSQKSATVTGVRGDIENYSAYAHTSSHQTQAYVQLIHTSSDAWVKIGYYRDLSVGATPRAWALVKTSGGSVFSETFGLASSTQNYKVQWFTVGTPPQGRMSVFINTLSMNTYATGTASSPDLAQALGEIQTRANQMVGGYSGSAPVRYSNLNVRQSGVWNAFAGTGWNSDSSIFGLNGISTTTFDIWDKACAS